MAATATSKSQSFADDMTRDLTQRYRVMVINVSNGEEVSERDIREVLLLLAWPLSKFRNDVNRLKDRSDLAKELATADQLAEAAAALKPQRDAATSTYRQVKAEADMAIQEAYAKMAELDSQVSKIAGQEKDLRQRVTEALRRTADPTIFVTVESLRQEKEAIERNVPEWRKTIAKARRWREQFAKWADPDCPGANMAFGGEWFPAWHPGMSYANVQADCRDALRGEQRTKAEENVKQAEEDAARAQKLLDDAPARIESIQQRMKELLAKAMLPESVNWDAD